MKNQVDFLDFEDIKEIIIKNWMTHDGMWFYHCAKECGIEKTNKINRSAVRSMAKVEIQRLKKALCIEQIESFEEFREFLRKTFSIVKAKFMDFDYEFPNNNALIFTMNNCFAYNGIKRMGYIEKYNCGIFERLKGWFDELNVRYDMIPQINGCMMAERNMCYRKFLFHFTSE
ncbi:MAG: DUF6125 family protein [Promethearchaeota archaeon]